MYTNVSVNISDKQKEQLKKALAAGEHLFLTPIWSETTLSALRSHSSVDFRKLTKLEKV